MGKYSLFVPEKQRNLGLGNNCHFTEVKVTANSCDEGMWKTNRNHLHLNAFVARESEAASFKSSSNLVFDGQASFKSLAKFDLD